MISKVKFESGRSKGNRNRKITTILVTIITIVLFLASGLPAFADDSPVIFADSGLETAIRNAISKPTGDIYPSDLEVLTMLKAEGLNINSIQGIEHCSNLKGLYLDMNQISDISPLASLGELEGLWIYMNQITDISPLAGLSNLTGVYLCYNQISDISPLAGLINLQVFYCGYNTLNDLIIISGLTNLSMVNIAGNKIEDITPLVSNTGIGAGDNLDLTHNFLDTTSGSSDMIDIQTLVDRGANVIYEPQDTPPAQQFSLTVSIVGTGNVTRTPDLSSYDAGTSVNLTATIAEGWVFTGWSGDLSGSDNPASVTMDTNKTITATFVEIPETYILTLNIIGSGNVTKTPDLSDYEAGTAITLAAVPDAGWHFYGWNGGLFGNTNPATLTISENKVVWATFVQESTGPYTLTISKSGKGYVTIDPDQYVYEAGSTANLTAIPDDGWLFAGWGGDLAGTTNPAEIIMDGNKMVSATFVSSSGSGSSGWWNSAWSQRKEINIQENSGVNLTDHQVKVLVAYDEDMMPDFSDIRFINPGDSSELVYWTDEFVSGSYADFWVKVPYIPASGNTKVFMYYGNASCNSASNIHDTFIWGDDFNDPEWTSANLNQVNYDSPKTGDPSTQYNTPEGLYVQKGGAASEPVAEIFSGGSMKAFPPNYIAEIEVNPEINKGYTIICPRYQSVPNKYEALLNIEFNAVGLNKVVDNNWAFINGASLLPKEINTDQWYSLSVLVTREGNINHFSIFVDGVHYMDAADSSLSYTGIALITYDENDSVSVFYDNFRIRTYASAEPSTTVSVEESYSDFLRELTVNIVGNGKVNRSLDLPYYEAGTIITLTAVPLSGWKFSGWSGDLISNANPVSLTIDNDKMITANFEVVSTPGQPVITGGGGGGGGPLPTLISKAYKNSDGQIVINVPAGTMFVTKSGYPCNIIEFQTVSGDECPVLPEGMSILSQVYNLTPDGATFNPPAQIVFYCDEARIPKGLNPSTIFIAYWDDQAGEWIRIENVTNDPSAGTIAAEITHLTIFALMAPTRPATFIITNLDITPESMLPGDTTVIAADISNNGDLEGSYEAVLKINGVENQKMELTTAGGETKTIYFDVTITEHGVYTIDVNGVSRELEVKEPAPLATEVQSEPLPTPASFLINNLTASPNVITMGESVTVKVEVINSGDSEGDYELRLKLDGEIMKTTKITLAGHSTTTAKFDVRLETPGQHTLEIDGTKALVTAKDRLSISPPSNIVDTPYSSEEKSAVSFRIEWIIAIIFGVVIIIGAIGITLSRRRKNIL